MTIKLFRLAALVALLVGPLVLLGWALDIDVLKRILPGLVAMNPLTALSFMAAGLALWTSSAVGHQTRLGRGCAYLVGAIGAIQFCGFLFDWESYLDQWLFAARLHELGFLLPNRMAPNTSLNFAILGVTLRLLYSQSDRTHRCAQYLAMVPLLTSSSAIIGYLLNATLLYRVHSFIPMAVHTAATFVCISLGVLFRFSRCGLMAVVSSQHASGLIARRLLPAAILAPVLLGYLTLLGQRAGFFDREFGVSLLVVFTILIFSAAIWWGAASLNRAELEHRRAEQAVESARNYAENIVNTVREPLLVLDRGLRVESANRAYYQLFQVKPAETVGTPLARLGNGQWCSPKLDQLLQAAIQGQAFDNYEVEHDFQQIGHRVMLLNAQQLNCLDDRGPMALLAIEDVTIRNQARKKIEELNLQLEERANLLEAANKELESFSSSVSHDLRALLRHVNGFAELLTKHLGNSLDPKGGRYLETITTSAKRMGVLIDELLVFSRMGRTEFRRSAVSLDQLVIDVRADLELEMAGRNINWTIDPLPVVQADGSMLRLVFTNLISNALKYTRPRNPAEIDISCVERTANEVVIRVRDNGVGFDMQYVRKLFGVFQRLHHANEFEGTGVGLANVRRIILRHGGRTWAEGLVGQGAAFYLALPRAVPSSSEAEAPLPLGVSANGAAKSNGPRMNLAVTG